jgi:hypothetical protein
MKAFFSALKLGTLIKLLIFATVVRNVMSSPVCRYGMLFDLIHFTLTAATIRQQISF